MDPEQSTSAAGDTLDEAGERRGRLDRLCDAFELKWQRAQRGQGESPRIEEYLADSREAEVGLLLRELLLVEWDYQPQLVVQDYLGRFPEHADIVQATFQEYRNLAVPAVDEAVLRDALFAGLLLQHRFLDAEEVAAAWAWESAESRPLAETLVTRAALTWEDAQLVGSLMQHYLDSYGGSLRAVVADLPCIHSACASLAAHVPDPRAQAALRFIAMGGGLEGAERGGGKARYSIHKFHRGGGLGQVWIASDQELPRQVALKDIRPQYARHPELQARFVREAQITGLLEHPGVVPVYGLGWHPDGRPFYAMRFIQGKSLDEVVKEFHDETSTERDATRRNLELRKLLRRFIDVCNTIEYAHNRGVLHRDLKPDNIMLGEFGETLVVDWGLARLSEESLAATPALADRQLSFTSQSSTLTQHGAALGTPAYMSPEQAEGRLESIGRATDIYGLGATLYCVLTGSVPFDRGSLQGLLEAVKIGDFPPPRDLNPNLPRALDAICRKAMATEPSARYSSAKELAEEIERWMADERVAAAPETWWQQLGRWARRNRTWVQSGALALLLITLISVVSSLVILQLWNDARASRTQAERSLARATRALYAQQVRDAAVLMPTDPGRALELLRDLATCPENLREFSWYHLYRVCYRNQHSWRVAESDTVLAAITANAERMIRVGGGGKMELREVPTGRIRKEVVTETGVLASALSVDGRRVATAHASGTVRLWNAAELIEIATFPGEHQKAVAVALSHDGGVVAAAFGETQSQIKVWNVFDQQSRGNFTGPSNIASLALAPDGTRLAAGGSYEASTSGGLRVWDLREGTESGYYALPRDLRMPPEVAQTVTALKFCGSRQVLLLGSNTGTLARIGLDELDRGGEPGWNVQAHYGTIRSLALHPSEAVIATAGVGAGGRAGIHAPHQPVKLWDSADFHRPLPYLAGLLVDVTHLSFSATGDQLLTLEQDGNVTIFSCTDQWTRTDVPHQYPVVGTAFSGDGNTLVTVALDTERDRFSVAHWDAVSSAGKKFDRLADAAGAWLMPTGQVFDVVHRAQGGAARGHDLRDALTGAVIAKLPEEQGSLAAVSPDRRWGAWVTPDGRLSLWNLVSPTRTAVISYPAEAAETLAVAFSPSGATLGWSTGLDPGRITLVEVSSGKTLHTFDELSGGISRITFSPEGRTLAVGRRVAPPLPSRSEIQRVPEVAVSLYDAETGQLRHTLGGHAGDVYALAFSPDGHTLATGGHDYKIRLWDVDSGICLLVLEGHTGSVFALDFSPDGLTLASASFDATARLWRTTSPGNVVDHEAALFVRGLADSIPLKSDLTQAVRRNSRITESVRARSLELAEQLPDDPAWLTQWGLQIALRPKLDRPVYQQALRYAQAARERLPDDPHTVMAVGTARYRCGDYAGAVVDLKYALELSQQQAISVEPLSLAFLAMARSRQGEQQEALSMYERLLSSLTGDPLSDSDPLQQVLNEAKTVLQVDR